MWQVATPTFIIITIRLSPYTCLVQGEERPDTIIILNIRNNEIYNFSVCNQRTMDMSISLQSNASLALMNRRHKFSIRCWAEEREREAWDPHLITYQHFIFQILLSSTMCSPVTWYWFIQNLSLKSVRVRYVGVFLLQYCADTAASFNRSGCEKTCYKSDLQP